MNDIDLYNVIIAILSLVIVCISSLSIRRKGIKSYNILFFMFFLCLFVNTLKLSYLQKEKTLLDIYYFFIGPLVFCLPLYIADRSKITMHSFSLPIITINQIFCIFLSSYILLKLYISSIVGWRIESLLDSTYLIDGDTMAVPGFTGLALSLQWLLLMLSPYVKKKFKYIFIISLIIFAFLHVKRGDIMRMFVFYFIYYLYNNFKNHSFRYIFKRSIIVIIVVLSVFVFLGNLRQDARGGGGSEVVELLEFKVDNIPLAWVYSYFAINYDVFKLYYDVPPTYKFSAILNTFAGEEQNLYNRNYNGFNASTFLTQFVIDFGTFFFIELFFFAVIISMLTYVSRILYLNSLYVFICGILFLFPFGNYFQSRAMFVSMFLFIITNIFLKKTSHESHH